MDLLEYEKKPLEPKPLNEANLLLSLHHPNIIKCYEYFTEKNHFCIVMEYCDNSKKKKKALKKIILEDLENQIREHKADKTPIPEEAILEWFAQLSLAIKYLHSKKILHRDIKIHNVFLMKSGLVSYSL